MKATLNRIVQETGHIRTYFFQPERALHYSAGQFAEVFLAHSDTDDRGDKRWFTLSSAPANPLISITTKHSRRSSSFKTALHALQPGECIQISDPLGDFVLPKDARRPLIFIAGGIGVTPFHSMMQELASHNDERDIRFIYGVASEDDIIFQSTFAATRVHATIVVERASAAWGGERGPVTPEIIIGLEQPSADSLFYLSGPEPMVESLVAKLKAAGIAADQLITDTFPGYPAI